MNHPLPKNEQGAIESNSENVAENTSPTWLTQNYRDDDAQFLVNQDRRKHEAAQASGQPENRTYEYYRRRIMERQREQMDSQMDRTPMAAVPPRPTIPAGELEGRHHF